MSNDAQELGAEVVASAGADADGQESLHAKYEDLCRELNMDCQTEEDAYRNFEQVSQRCSLEGDPKHWFCCALYASCRQSSTPTVSGQDSIVMGNCVSLNNLLRSCQMSIYEFKTKIKQWCYMANLSQEFIHQIEELERKFSITFTLYKNYRNIFEQVFLCPPNEKKHTKYSGLHSTHAHGKCSYLKLDDICWRLFLCAKNQKPTTTVDLVTSFNLMICCIDVVYANVLAEKRIDLIRTDFAGLPPNWNTPEFNETKAREHCILKYFCEMTDEAKTMKATIFNKIMRSFFDAKTIYGNKDTLLGLVAKENFERNLKSLNISYEQYVLSVGEFDERILAAYPLDTGEHTNLTEQALRPPVTPLTRKQDLPAQPSLDEQKFEPVANATNNVKQLSAFKRITEPTEFVKQAGKEVIDKMLKIIEQMEQKFLDKYPILSEAKNRFRLAKSLHFNLLDHILRDEINKKPDIDLKLLVVPLDTFNITLMACCVELVLEAYNTELKFPWILECFSINAFQFHKIIELVVRHGSDVGILTRTLVKHLNSIEETCLERLAWFRESPVWGMIARASKPLPTCNEVNLDKSAGPLQIFLRKVYLLGWLRIQKLCGELNLCDKKPEKIWTIFEHSITHKTELMQDRHLDQIIMCAIYIYIRVTKMQDPKFIDIMRAYRNQSQAVNSVYREVLISVNDDGTPKNKDIIYFYNNKYVPEMTPFAINYLNEKVEKEDLLLSPHPIERLAVPKKLTQNHALYVSQMSKNEIQQSPNQMIYEFYRSPAKDLQLMNEKVRGKRVLSFGEEPGLGIIEQKRARELPTHLSQIKTVMDDRESEHK